VQAQLAESRQQQQLLQEESARQLAAQCAELEECREDGNAALQDAYAEMHALEAQVRRPCADCALTYCMPR
jgi:prefoldin subunit 5